MDIRNVTDLGNGAFSCEVEHELLGWIPFNATPDDVSTFGQSVYNELIASSDAAEYTPITQATLSAQAMLGMANRARSVRANITGEANIERALGWVLKAFFASAWKANDAAPTPLLQPLADVAAAGFVLEADITGETPEDLRDRSIEKAGEFFLALQLVEGMERVAETQINAADTPEALVQTIDQLRVLEAAALTKLAELQNP